MITSGAPAVVVTARSLAESEDGDHFQAQALPTVHAFPWRHTKTIHFIRHGEGYHNGALTDKVLGIVKVASCFSRRWWACLSWQCASMKTISRCKTAAGLRTECCDCLWLW